MKPFFLKLTSTAQITLILILSMLLSACGGGGQTTTSSELGIQLLIVSGNDQVGAPTKTFADSLVVKAVDGTGKPVSNVPVTFVVEPGDTPQTTATLTMAGGVVTGTDGTARVQVVAPSASNSVIYVSAKMELSNSPVRFHLITRSYPDAPLLTLRDAVTASTAYTMGTTVGATIISGSEVAKWCLSETQTTRPGSGSSQCASGGGSSNGWFTSKPLSFNLTGTNGVKTVYIWVADQYDQVNLLPSTASIFLDTVAPGTPFITLRDIATGVTTDTSQANVDLEISNDGDASYWCIKHDLAANALPADPNRASSCWENPKPVRITLAGLGMNRVSVWLKDLAGNITAVRGEQLINFTTATMADPVLAVQDPTTSSSLYARQPSVSLTVSSDIGASRWCVSETQTTRPPTGLSTCVGGQGAVNGWTLTRPTNFNLSPGNGSKTVYVWVANPFHNTSASAVTRAITLDTTAPAIPIIDLLDPNTHQPNFTNQNVVDLEITSDTDAAAWCTFERSQASSPPSLPAYNDACWVMTRPTTVALSGLGSRRVYLYTKDLAQNVTPAPAVGIITYTTASPTDPVLAVRDQLTNSTTLTRDRHVNISVYSPDLTSRWCVSESQTVKPGLGTLPCVGGSGPANGWYTTSPTTFELTAGDGVKTVYVWVANSVNTVNVNPSTTPITLDTTAPPAPTVVMKDPNTSSVDTTNQLQVTLQITGDTDAVRWCRILQGDADAAPATPLITDVCWGTSRPTTQYMDALGLRKLYVFTRDAAGNVSTPGATNITYTTDAPTDPTITLADVNTGLSQYVKGTALNLSISNDTGAERWCVSETQSTRPSLGTSTCAGGTGPSSGWFTAKPSAFTLAAADGVHRVYVWTANESNTVNYNPTFASTTLDTGLPAAPTIALRDPNTNSVTNTNQALVGLTITGDTDALAWCSIEQAFATSAPARPTFNDACWTLSRPLTQTLGALGTRRVFLYTRDAAYNVSATAATTTMAYSAGLPATPSLTARDGMTLSTSFAKQNAVTVSITSDTDAVKWCLSELQNLKPSLGTTQCDGGTGSASGWHTSRPSTFSLSSGDGSKTLYLWTANVSNTVSAVAATAVLTLDTVPPSVPFTQITDSTTGSQSITNQSPAALSITLDTDAVGWFVIEQASATAAPSAPAWNASGWVTTRPTTIGLGAQGNRRSYIYTRDLAMNVTPAASVASITYSTTPPTDPSMVLTSSLGSASVTKDLSVGVSITSPSGTVLWCVSETQSARPANGSATCAGGQGSTNGWSTSLPSTFTLSSTDALKTVYVWVADNANNVNANASSSTITLDTAPPATPIVAMSDINTASTTNTNQVSVNLSITGDTDANRWCRILQADADAAPSTPALTDGCWVTPRPTSVFMDATGLRKLYVFTRDVAGNVGSAGAASINYSTLSPVDATLSMTDSVTGLSTHAKQTALNISITGDTGATRWCVSETQTTRPNLGTSVCLGGAGGSNGWATSRPSTVTLSTGDATKRVYVWTSNSSNSVNGNPVSQTIVYDTAPPAAPTVTLLDVNTGSSSQTNQGTVNVNLSGDGDATAWCVVEQAGATAAPSAPLFSNGCWSTTRPTTLALGATGTRKAYVFTRDVAYNVSTTSGVGTIIYSTSAPLAPTLSLVDATTSLTTYARQVAVNASIASDATATRWCLSETQTSKPALGTSPCNGGVGSTNGWHSARPTALTLSVGDAAKTAYLWIADASNNVSATAATASITLDTAAPAVPVSTLSDTNTASTAFTNLAAVNLSITSDTSATGWCVLEQLAALAAPASPLFNNVCWVTTRPTSQTLGGQGDRRVYVFTRDAAQNVSAAPSIASINYSTTAPTDPVLVLSDNVTGSRLFTNTPSVGVSINNPSGAAKWCLSQTQTSQPANGTAICNGGAGPSNGWYTSTPTSFSLAGTDGLKTVYIWVANSSNTVNSNASFASITLKVTAPLAPTVALRDPNTLSASLTNQNNVQLTITADSQASAWCTGVRASTDSVTTSPVSTDPCWSLTRPTLIALGAVGSRTVDVFVRDSAMNVSPAGSATITLDVTPPVDPTITVADTTTSSTSFARSTSVTLAIANDSAATRWCVSETQSVKPSLGTSTCVSGGGSSSGWYTTRPTTFTLSSGDGVKRVYVWIANAANNVSDNSVYSTITLDTVASGVFTITGVTGGSDMIADQWLGTTLIPTLNWNASSDAATYKVTILNAAGAATICPEQTTSATSFTFSGCSLVNGTSYRARVVAVDAALNERVATNANFAFAVDLSPPAAFSITGINGSQDTLVDAWSGTSLPTVNWATATGASSYTVKVIGTDGTTTVCALQTKASGLLTHDYSTTGCSPPLSSDENFYATVSATSISGNTTVASNSLYLFHTDLTAPSISISSNPAAASISKNATFVYSGADAISGVVATDCKVDSGSFAACSTSTSQSYAALAEGSHTFTVRVTDRVGFQTNTAYPWSIDSVAPGAFTITGATGATDADVDQYLWNDNRITAHWTASSSADSYDVSILNADDSVACSVVTVPTGTLSYNFSSCPISYPLTYKIKVVSRRGYGTTAAASPMTITTRRDSVALTTVASASTVTAGATLTIDMTASLNGVAMTTGGLNPTFSISGGMSAGTFGSVTDNGNGSYRVIFTGTTAGTASTIVANTAVKPVGSSTGASVSVLVGAPSAATSTVVASKTNLTSDGTDSATVTVTLRDSQSNLILSGASVSAAHAGGVSTLTINAFAPAGSGQYTTSVKGLKSGSPTNFTVTAAAVNITPSPIVFTVFPGPPKKLAVSGPTTGSTNACFGPYVSKFQDVNGNVTNALLYTTVSVTGLTNGTFSTFSDCRDSVSEFSVGAGSQGGPDLYAMARSPGNFVIDYVDTASTAPLTHATAAVTVAGTISWIGAGGGFNWGLTDAISARGNTDGQLYGPSQAIQVGLYVYVTDTLNHRIVRYNASTKQPAGWVGRVDSTDTIAGSPVCSALASGSGITQSWCTGGTSQSSAGATIMDGMFSSPIGIASDGTFLYITDAGNSRIVRLLLSGEWAGWYGRRNAGTLSSGTYGDANCPNIITQVSTGGWCNGGSPLSSSGASNWDGMFNTPRGITFYRDGSNVEWLFVVDSTNRRVTRMSLENPTAPTWKGWVGRTNSALPPSGNAAGFATANACVDAASTVVSTSTPSAYSYTGIGSPGWCMGGTTVTSTLPSASYDNTNWNSMFSDPRDTTVMGSYLIVADASPARFSRFLLTDGTFQGWTGRTRAHCPTCTPKTYNAAIQASANGNANCGAQTNNNYDVGWCTGGVSENFRNLGVNSITNDGTYFYYSNSGSSVFRMQPATPGTDVRFIGRLNTQPTGGLAACLTTPLGQPTPGWCAGGSSRIGYTDGTFHNAQFLSVSGGILYTADYSDHKIQTHNVSDGTTAGFIGAVASLVPPTWRTTFSPNQAIMGTGAAWNANASIMFPDDNSVVAHAGTGAAASAYPQGIVVDGSKMFTSDTYAHRLKYYNTSTGAYQGWFGRVSNLVPNAPDACLDLSNDSITPAWCKGGNSYSGGSGTAKMTYPRGLASDGTHLYVADTSNHRINKIDQTTTAYIGWLGRTGTITVTSGSNGMDGVDQASSDLCTVLGSNTATGAWCLGGTNNNTTGATNFDGMFNSPYDVTVQRGTPNYLYVADTGSNRVTKFNADTGAFIGWIGRKNTTAPTGSYDGVTSDFGCKAAVATTPGTPVWCKGGNTTASANSVGFNGFSSPRGVSYAAGYLYVADYSGNRVQKFDAVTGAFMGWIGMVNNSPSSNGATSTLLPASGTAGSCANTGANVATPGWCIGGQAKAVSSGSTFDGGFNGPQGVYSDGVYLYVVDTNNHRIVKYDAVQGTYIGWMGSINSPPTAPAGPCTAPSSALDTATPTWCQGGTSKAGRNLGAFSLPSSITGNGSFIYVVDGLNNRIQAIPK